MTLSNATTRLSFPDERWVAAEEAALQLGWLSECPYHGEPFRAPLAREKDSASVATIPGDIVALVIEVCESFQDNCPICVCESAQSE